MRAYGRGKRWLLLRRWKSVRGSKRRELEQLFAAYCDHAVRFGVVEAVNTTIKGVLRRARGMRDEAFLVLKLKWATARPIRTARDYARFLHAESLHSNR